MNEVVVWSLLPLSLLMLGGAMIWFAAWRQQHQLDASPFARPSYWLTILGWVVVLIGGIALAFTTALFFAPLVIVVAALVMISGVFRYWRSEVRFLIWSIAEAAQRGIPLEKAARAFASERHGRMAHMARRLAEYLDAAVPLTVALEKSGVRVSPEVRLAADLGEKTGTLGLSLEKAVQQSNVQDGVLGAILAKFFYLGCVLSVMVSVVSFMMIAIVPTFEQMFTEFDLELPPVTMLLIDVSRLFVNYWFVLMWPLLILMVLVVLGLLMFVGVPVHSLPVLRRFVSPVDDAIVLHSLATAVEQQQTVTDNLSLLSGLAQSSRSRDRLAVVMERIHEGTHWSDALQSSGFISKTQNAVIRSAERAGNLAWALNEMADTMLRRTTHRAQAALNTLFPICLVSFGVCVFFVAVGMLMPLFTLIGNLA